MSAGKVNMVLLTAQKESKRMKLRVLRAPHALAAIHDTLRFVHSNIPSPEGMLKRNK